MRYKSEGGRRQRKSLRGGGGERGWDLTETKGKRTIRSMVYGTLTTCQARTDPDGNKGKVWSVWHTRERYAESQLLLPWPRNTVGARLVGTGTEVTSLIKEKYRGVMK